MENSEHSVVAVVKTTALKHPVLSVWFSSVLLKSRENFIVALISG